MIQNYLKRVATLVIGISGVFYLFWDILGVKFQEAAAENLIFIVIPALSFATYCNVRRIRPWSEALQHTGIPLGILVSSVSFVGDLQNILDIELLVAVGKAFYSVLYGGVIAASGYLLSVGSENNFDLEEMKKPDLIVLMSTLIIFFLALGATKVELGFLIDPHALLIFASPTLVLAIRFGFKVERNLLLRSCIVGMLACCLISMIAWVGADDAKGLGPALVLGLLGLVYGSLSLLCISLTSSVNGVSDAAQWRAAWHTLEIYALLALVIYAPPSLIEFLNALNL